ncbi:MAG: EamA family transporter [Cyanobacteria bacterium P01_A01_bin.37]
MHSSTGRARWFAVSILALGVLAVSTSAILIRLTLETVTETGIGFSLVISAARLVVASTILLPTWRQVQGTTHQPGAIAYSAIAGVLLAGHFASWTTSLSFTSIAASTTLVTTNPVWVALISWLWLRERPSTKTLLGIAITIAGSLFIGLADSGSSTMSQQPVLGNSLALTGAVTASGYFLLGREAQRRGLPIQQHAAIAYTVAALTLLPLPIFLESSYVGYPALTYGYIVLMAIVPQLIGHTSLNWAVHHISPTIVTLTILLEPIGASLLGYALFREAAGSNVLAGAVIIIIGVAIAVTGQSSPST